MKTFAIVTPVKDEINYFPKTVKSVLSQYAKPQKWIIIDDGSTDGTTEIIRKAERENDWIEGIYREPNKNRKPGGEFVLEIGLKKLNIDEYDFIVRMDGDLEFESNYFRVLFEKFDDDPKLGIASGVCFITRNGKAIEEKHPRFHTRGPLKTYRAQCFKNIGGLLNCLGWDSIDDLKANKLNWHTHSFPELRIHHLKKTQSHGGIFKSSFNKGVASYNSGYHPLFVLFKTVYILIFLRYKSNSIGVFWGYFSSMIKLKPKPITKELIKYIRKQQMNKLLGRETIWK
ncbi:MAG TPA: glycosyltransferase family 2 protein [Ignavibacteriaceae bacterium]|nr:glycosyltransferase family 2 protein [Ignavibacteriaceae bacterium]